jgi:hypothetical protein
MGLIASAMAVVLTERASTASTSISVGLYITVRAIGGSLAGAGFAALLTRVTIARHRHPTRGPESGLIATRGLCGP